jgi:hypothetical protein
MILHYGGVPECDSRTLRMRDRKKPGRFVEECGDIYVTTGVSPSYRYTCFLDRAVWQGGGTNLRPSPPCTETMNGVVKGVKKK